MNRFLGTEAQIPQHTQKLKRAHTTFSHFSKVKNWTKILKALLLTNFKQHKFHWFANNMFRS